MSPIQAEGTTDEHSSPPTSLLLVVDDNSMNRIMLSRYITKLGYQANLAENGRQALEKLQSKSFDLVLLDVEMPEMDGYQVLEQMKTTPRLRDIPVIMISAVEELESVVRCIELGAQDTCPNPLTLCCCGRGLPRAWNASGCATRSSTICSRLGASRLLLLRSRPIPLSMRA